MGLSPYNGVYDWQSTDITVNYKKAYGEIIAVFQGHRHTDAEWEYFKNVPFEFMVYSLLILLFGSQILILNGIYFLYLSSVFLISFKDSTFFTSL